MSTTFDVYIAIPYSHEDERIRHARFEVATAYFAHLINRGIYAFSPITNSHPPAEYGVRTDWDFWEGYDKKVLDACSEIHVLTMPGWGTSKGVTEEINYARSKDMPVKYISPKGYHKEDPVGL